MSESRTSRFRLRALIIGNLFLGTAFFFVEGDNVTACVLIIILLSSMFGHWIKASRILSLTLGMAAAVVLGPPLAESCELSFANWFGTSGELNKVLCLIVIGGWILFGVSKLLHLFLMRDLLERQSPDTFNRISGFGIGAFDGVVLSMVMIGALMNLEPRAKQHLFNTDPMIDNLVMRSLSQKVIDCAAQTRESAVGRLIADVEFLEQFKMLKPIHDALGHPGQELALGEPRAEL